MQHDDPSDILKFQRFSRLDGSTERAGSGKRNGKSFPILPRESGQPDEQVEETPFWEQERLFVNLNPIERETWTKILKGQSIKDIARGEAVSRSAIYSRIIGNSKSQGGMIGKNFWVLLWWLMRQRQNRSRDSL